MSVQRRNLLKGIGVSVLALSLGTRSLVHAAVRATKLVRRVRPTDPAWPSPASWQALKDAVGGNLIEVKALFGSCATDATGAACADVIKHMHNPFFIGDQPAGTQVSGWLGAWTPAPSAYAVKARNSSDVAAAVQFANHNNLRLVVKGGGHSYQGTSNAPDSLLIWTRAMNSVELHDAFVPRGCEGRFTPVSAVTAEAGAVWIDLYHAVTTIAGRYVQGGGCTTVGVAGHVQSGGFGSWSKGFGTAASNLLEAEIVTADGTIRTVNACSDPDLFWAIKGGGGGSWGVITRVTLRTHELPENFGAAWGTIKANTDDAFRELMGRFIAFYAESLHNPNWGEIVHFEPDNTLKLSMLWQGLDPAKARQIWQPFFSWIDASPDKFKTMDKPDVSASLARHFWNVPHHFWDIRSNSAMIADSRDGARESHGWWHGDQEQVGAFLHGYDSLWLAESLLQENERLTAALFAASRHKRVDLHFNKGLAGASAEVRSAVLDTAMNPSAVKSFALAIIADGEGSAYPGFARPAMDVAAARADAKRIDAATAELRRIAPEPGSYVSESNYFNPEWQQAFWGANYRKLRTVKAAYDPDGLFFVHHGVGSEEWSADGFTRVAKL